MVFDLTKVDDFWYWFSRNEGLLKEDLISGSLIAQLEEVLFSFCKLDWEIGAESNGCRFFAVSPVGDPSLADGAKILLSRSPSIEGWVFYSHKPPKEWNLIFTINFNGQDVQIDGKKWSFVAFKFSDGVFEIDFYPPSSLALPKDVLESIAVTLIDGELGEERRLKLVEKVNVVSTWGDELKAKSRRLEKGLLSDVIL